MSHLSPKSQLKSLKISQSFNNQKFNPDKIKKLIETHGHTIEIINPYAIPKFTSDPIEKIPIRNSTCSYNHFFENHLVPNVPCIITNVTANWPCMNTWIDDDRHINFEYLRKKFGNGVVPVANCKKKYFDSHEKVDMKVSEYLDYFENPNKEKLLYLKDWHCRKEFPLDEFYKVPKLFASDWLNEYTLATMTDDYMFVYMGPAGTWTPLHVDVYNSYSWSVNIIGSKKWRLYPPGQEELLRDNNGHLPFDCLTIDVNNKAVYYEVIQKQGDAIFIPSSWYHQVWNMEDTISINHNWINGCNLRIMWRNLQVELKKVEKEIADCIQMENWAEQCQLLLRASFGMNYFDFYNFIHEIANRRISRLNHTAGITCFKSALGINHCRFDLSQINEILMEYTSCDVLVHMNTTFESNLLELIEKILQALGMWESILGNGLTESIDT